MMVEPRSGPSSAGRVDVFVVDLDQAPEEALHLLSPGELARVERVRHPLRARRRAAAAAAVRVVLASITGVHPSEVRFALSANGKPLLEPRFGWEFNASRSEGTAVVAVADHPVGIDLETVLARRYRQAVARRFFPPSISTGLDGLPGVEGERAFVRTWTRLEAWVKATGEGLQPTAIAAVPEAALRLSKGPRWVRTSTNRTDRGGWWVIEPYLGPTVVGTVVVGGETRPRLHLDAESIWT